ncbi:glycosyltransferase family 4 protein [Oxynema sp. CENA135]|uniref:glycosyltransferase family 4 protein n=1 Tax=Oxynema sp. CENA135 TaxID=984206 RepID=UPI00190AAB56|nr:glycosyltransferase family 1 protein [Oxynema sp. CENA135]MBK4730633.1 glycosyltransferase family 4 protein [Oxynema sp. CENA135]
MKQYMVSHNKYSLKFDDIIYQLQGHGGISVYWQELTSRVLADRSFRVSHITGKKSSRYFPVISNEAIFHSSYYRFSLSKKTKNVVTCYDFAEELDIYKTLGSQLNIFQRKLAVKAADAIICISESTKQDLLKLYPNDIDSNKVNVVHLANSLHPINTLNKTKKFHRILKLIEQVNNLYVLYVGRRTVRKNFKSALLGFAGSQLPQRGYSMVCTGDQFLEDEKDLFSSLGLKDTIFVVEKANNQELSYLYQNAFALVYPSLYEGFGLPPLEAMSCGCPVIASCTSSIPEVVGDTGVMVHPDNYDAISDALNKFLDPHLRQSYINKGLKRSKLFSWDKVAEEHLKIYKKLIEKD